MKRLLKYLIVASCMAYLMQASAADDPDAWGTTDTAREVALAGLFALDYKQTKEILRQEAYNKTIGYRGVQESNPIVTQHNASKYFLGAYLLQLGASTLMYSEHREILQDSLILLEVGVTAHNRMIGVRVKF